MYMQVCSLSPVAVYNLCNLSEGGYVRPKRGVSLELGFKMVLGYVRHVCKFQIQHWHVAIHIS